MLSTIGTIHCILQYKCNTGAVRCKCDAGAAQAWCLYSIYAVRVQYKYNTRAVHMQHNAHTKQV